MIRGFQSWRAAWRRCLVTRGWLMMKARNPTSKQGNVSFIFLHAGLSGKKQLHLHSKIVWRQASPLFPHEKKHQVLCEICLHEIHKNKHQVLREILAHEMLALIRGRVRRPLKHDRPRTPVEPRLMISCRHVRTKGNPGENLHKYWHPRKLSKGNHGRRSAKATDVQQ